MKSGGSSPGASAFPVRAPDWLSVAQAERRVLSAAAPLPVEHVPLAVSVGRALASDVRATATLPPWDNSAMDGYAVRARDIRAASAERPAELRVSGVVRAGAATLPSVGEGCAVRIMTGAPLPPGADTVVRVEDTDAEASVPDLVRILDDRDAHRHIRPAGQDMRAGDVLLRAGHSVTAGTLGVLAAAGVREVPVHRPPSVAILATGDELRTPDRYDDVRSGLGVPESNGGMLAAIVEGAGGRARLLGVAADDPESLCRHIEAGSEADVLVTIGGASMGEADFVKRVLDDFGFELDFWRVKMRPGSPISFGWLKHGARRQAVFGLPGNPSSAFVTCEVFVRPFLLRQAGHARVLRRTIECRSASEVRTPAELTYFQRVQLRRQGRETVAELTGSQGSGLVSGLARADGLAVIPPATNEVLPGREIEVMLLDTGPAAHPYEPE